VTLTPEERIELDRLVAEQAEDLEWLQRVERAYPLATSVLWTAEAPSTGWDQRRSVVAALRARSVTIVKGGWRSGKSEGLKQLTVAMALGGDHPMVRRWLELNDLPTDIIPDGPEQVYAIAPSSNDSIRFHRDDFDRLTGSIPKRWLNRNAKGEALLELQVPGHARRGKIWFKSVDQTRKAFQGISIRWWWIDEEPLGDVGYGVYDELRARVADQEGRGAISMVPMEGITWVHDKLERDREDDAQVVELDALDNPHLPASFRRIYTGMSEDEVQVRRFGRFRSRSGTIYAFIQGDGDRWGPGHVCDDFEIPADWPRFRAADFGLVNPTCVGWAALGDDDTLYIYREYYQPNGESYAWHARNAALAEGWDETPDGEVVRGDRADVIEASCGDPGGSSGVEAREAFGAIGMGMGTADKDVSGGIDRVKERLRIRGDNRPRLKVFKSCTNTIREMQGYVWDPNRKDEVPLKKNDHACDMVRYMCAMVADWSGLLCW
jgi:phage terminase large subunit-like protein